MVFNLGYKMFLRRGISIQSILAIALLVAILASTNSIANYIGLQAQTIGKIITRGGVFLILSQGSASIMESQVDVGLANSLSGIGYVKNVLPQRMLTVTLTMGLSNHTIHVRAVRDVAEFLRVRGAYLNGTAARGLAEVNMGEVLAKAFSINIGDEGVLALNDKHIRVRVVGIFRSQTQSDAELIVPMEASSILTGDNHTVSFIEFSLREDVNNLEAVNQIMQILPGDVKLIQVQQTLEFLRQMNIQTAAFLNIWSIVVYVTVAAASYIISTRIIVELSYEISMLRALGAKKLIPFILVLAYTITVALLGSILGIALGIAGTQIVSTILRWITPNIDIEPFLEVEQAIQTLLLTLTSSILGCIYPALKSTRTRYIEQPL